jgi:prophage tail gpP-like protein
MDAQVHLPREFNGMTPLSIMTALAAPFGVSVEYVIMGLTVNDPMHIPIPSYSAMPGERAFEAIERLARTMSVLVTDNAQGDLVLIRFDEFSTNNPFGAKVPIIKVGGADGNAKIADGLFSFEQRYSHVIVRGQRPGTASDYGATVSSQLGRARDPEVLRRRVLIVDADEPSSIAQLNARAAWEAATRAGRGVSVTYEMEGWRWGDGSQKEPGQLVRVIDPPRGIDATMLLVTAGWSEDSEKKQSTVTLAPPGGYEMLAPEKRQAAGSKAITNGDDYNVWLTAEQVRTIKREAGQ